MMGEPESSVRARLSRLEGPERSEARADAWSRIEWGGDPDEVIREVVESYDVEQVEIDREYPDEWLDFRGAGSRCPTCEGHPEAADGQLIPVWEDPGDYEADEDPDFIGCTECHIMRELSTARDGGGDP